MIEWSWPNAMTLAERARVFANALPDRSVSPSAVERARKRLAKWKSQPPFNASNLLQQRLLQVGLSESQLLELLTSGPSSGAPPNPPDWAMEVSNAFAAASNGTPDLGAELFSGQPEYRMLELFRPLIVRAINRLRDGLRDLPLLDGTVPSGAEPLEQVFVRLLPDRLLPIVLRTMVLELNVARVQGFLSGETSQERFGSFIERIRQPEIAAAFLNEYPVLTRLVATALEDWLSCSLEFLQRWRADWPAICSAFDPAADPGPFVRIVGDAGDSHRGGRSVWIVECRSGFKLVYKPKPLGVAHHFQQLLQWLNEHGLSAPFRTLRILDRGCYGWEEFVASEHCSSTEQVNRFYQRSGGYLALLYAVAASDFHHQNLLAAGEHPFLIDLEGLFDASNLEQTRADAADLAGQTFAESVLGSGLLPLPTWNERRNGVFDFSGLGAEVTQSLPTPAPGWKDFGTDQMQFVRKFEATASSNHRATLNGTATNPLDYLADLENGFRQVYELLEKHRDELAAPGGWLERFAGDEVRVILRNTSFYAELLQESSHPDVLRDALDRDRLFDRLWEDVTERPGLAEVIPAEMEALWHGDIPLFTSQVGSCDLSAGAHHCLKDFLSECGLDRARRRLRQFGPADLERQLWFLRASLTTLASRARGLAHKRQAYALKPVDTPSREELLAAACAVGDHLAATVFHSGEKVTWIGLTLMRERQWVLAPLGIDLYDGVLGIGLFLAYLGALSGQERYSCLARAALNAVRNKIRNSRQRRENSSGLGAFAGWGGVLYALPHLAVLWDDPALFSEAHEIVELLPTQIENDRDLDIVGGAAGCIAGLLCLHACSPNNRVLKVAEQCGEHLLAHAQAMPQGLAWSSHGSSPLTGFSHGAAGISWALLELAAQTGDDRFRMAALGGIEYERSLFSAETGNWPDLRPPVANQKQPEFLVSWCHGAPGIGLSRFLCRHVDETAMDAEIEAALGTTLAQGFGRNHCLCHGDLGNVELLLEAGRIWPESGWGKEVERLVACVLDSINREGWLCGNPLAVESPGLMTGIAGIGYGLLRCAAPERVPSVLSLAPPVACPAHPSKSPRLSKSQRTAA